MVHRLEADYWGQVDFVYLDGDRSETSEIRNRYAMFGQPQFVFITAEGDIIQRFSGGTGEGLFREAFDEYLDGAGG
jgi:hypothetical protein